MRKDELIMRVAEACEISKQRARCAVGTMLDAIIQALNEEGKANLLGFGTFSIRRLGAREVRIPRTGEKILAKSKNKVRFKPSKRMLDILND